MNQLVSQLKSSVTEANERRSSQKKSVAVKPGARKIIAATVCVIAVVWAIIAIKSFFGHGPLGDPSMATFVCSQTGKAFLHHNEVGETIPILSPYSGKKTGYPGEPCYWTKDGGTKSQPTWVLLNHWINKPGPTFCPDCGRLVVPRNPPPTPGRKPPPTREELLHKNSATASDSAKER